LVGVGEPGVFVRVAVGAGVFGGTVFVGVAVRVFVGGGGTVFVGVIVGVRVIVGVGVGVIVGVSVIVGVGVIVAVGGPSTVTDPAVDTLPNTAPLGSPILRWSLAEQGAGPTQALTG
jgi:hypothetical protein